MTLIDIEEIIRPISQASPCGDDIIYDEDFLSLKEKRSHSDELSLGKWKEKKSLQSDENNKTIAEVCVYILKNKSKSLQIIAFLLEDMVKKNSIEGLEEGLNILIHFFENYWENCHPLSSKATFAEDRLRILRWIDEKLSSALRLSFLLSPYIKERLSFNEIEKINGIGNYSKNSKYDIGSENKTKYQSFIKKLNADLIQNKIHRPIESSLETLTKLSEFLKNHLEIDNNFFFNLTSFLNDIDGFFKGFILKDNKEAAQNNHQVEDNPFSSQDNAENDASPRPSALTYDGSRNSIYEKIYALAQNLLTTEPHSPVPHFLFKLCTWKDKSFVEIVAELGLNSPMFDFLNHPENKPSPQPDWDSPQDR